MVDWFYGASVAASVLFTAALLPQFVRTYKLGRAEDISLWFVITVLAASALMGTWAASPRVENWAIVGSQGANLVVWGYVLKMRLWPRNPSPSG